MIKVRNQSLVILLLVIACVAPPAIARPHLGLWLAQADNPDASGDADPTPEVAPANVETDTPPEDPTVEPVPAETIPTTSDEAPPELTPTFTRPDQLPDGTTLTIERSSSMGTITRALVEEFESAYPNASVDLVEQPAEAALSNLKSGEVDLAAIGRPLDDEQKAEGLAAVSVSREKIALIVGEDNPYDGEIEAEDFVRIFRGEITNWSELGGPDLPLRFVDRPDASDTRAALGQYEIFEGNLTTGDTAVRVDEDNTAAVVEALGDNGIGYAIASQVVGQENVRVISMHNTAPEDPRYPYSQPRNYVYRSTETLPIAVEAFLALATDAQGQEAVAEAKAAEAAEVAAANLPEQVNAVRPNGEGFVTGDLDGTLNFWTIDGTSDGEPVSAHTGPVTAIAVRPDGQLISGGADGTIRLADADGTATVEPINAGNGPVTSLTAQPDGSFISASADGTLQRWDAAGTPVGEPITGHEGTVRDIALVGDGSTLVTASEDGTIRRWAVADGTPIGDPLVGHQGAVQALAAMPDGGFFSGGADGTVRRWNAEGVDTGSPVQVAGPVAAIAAAAEGATIAAGDETGSLQYLTGEGTPAGSAIDVGAPIADLAVVPSGDRLIVSAGEDPQVRDSTGQLIAAPVTEEEAPEADEASESDLPPQIQEFWEQLQQLPPQVLWIIPVLVLALLLIGILRSFRQDQEDFDEDNEVMGALPASRDEGPSDFSDADFSDADFSDAGFSDAGFSDADFSDADISDDSFSDAGVGGGAIAGITPNAGAESLDPSLAKAKQTISTGISLGNEGRYQDALDRFNKAIELADMERLKAAAAGTTLAGAGIVIARGLARRGTALANLDRNEEALKSLNRSLEMNPNDAAAWIGKGHVLAQLGQLDEALFCFDKAIELNPNIAAAWQGKGTALQKMGRDAEARDSFAQADSLGRIRETIPIELGTPISSESPVDYVNDGDDIPVIGDRPDPVPMNPSPNRPDRVSDPVPPLIEPIDREPIANEAIITPQTKPVDEVEIDPTPETYPDTVIEEEIPTELQSEVADLPPEPDYPPPGAEVEPPIPVPPEVEAILNEGDATIADIPNELLETTDDSTPDEWLNESDLSTATSSAAPPIDIPPDVDAILMGQSDIPTVDAPEGDDDVRDPMAAFFGNDPTASMRPARSTSPASELPFSGPEAESDLAFEAATDPTQSEDELGYDPGLEGLPPEVLEALRGIPEDSPDSFNLPPASKSSARQAPPPPPNNPRLKNPSPDE